MLTDLIAGWWLAVAGVLFLLMPFLAVWLLLVVRRAGRDLHRIADALEGASYSTSQRVIPRLEMPVSQPDTAPRPPMLSTFGR